MPGMTEETKKATEDFIYGLIDGADSLVKIDLESLQ
jgi:hypothetical protein